MTKRQEEKERKEQKETEKTARHARAVCSFRFHFFFLILPFFLFLSVPSRAISSAAGTAGGAFLDIGQGSARAMALGHSFVAMANGVDAITWNPAGLADTPQRELAYSYLDYVQGLNTPIYLAYAQPTGRTVWGANFAYLSDSNFDVRDANGIPLTNENVHVYDAYATLSAARSFLYEKLYLGASLRFVHEDNAGAVRDNVVGDVGVMIKPSPSFSLGFSEQNFGASPSQVGSTTRGGAAYAWNDFITTSLEVNKAVDDTPRIGVGAEFQIPEEYLQLGQLSFRLGYYSSDNLGQSYDSTLKALSLDRTSGLSFGLGLYTSQAFGYALTLDYAFEPFGALGAVDQLTLRLDF